MHVKISFDVPVAKLKTLATWRGYSLEACRELVAAGHIGLSDDGNWAFPIKDDKGQIIGIHKLVDPKNKRWVYEPTGAHLGAYPLVHGDLQGAQLAVIVESSWDYLALLILTGSIRSTNIPVLCTRGTGGANKLKDLLPPGIRLVAIPQNDDAGTKNWLVNLGKAVQPGAIRRLVTVPAPHHDLNDWLKAGATGNDLKAAVQSATPYVAPNQSSPSSSAKPAAAANSRSFLEQLDPWPDPVNASEIFAEIAYKITKHLVISEHARVTVTLWAMMTWCPDAVDTLPVLVISSPDKRCGKTRLLSVLKRVVKNPIASSNISPAALYRTIEKYQPTLLVDEFDSFGKDNEDLRNVINSGHSRDSTDMVVRCHPNTHEPETFSTYAPKAIGLIGRLHPTTHDRSIQIEMARKKKSELVRPLRDTLASDYLVLRRKLLRWVSDHKDEIQQAKPQIPDSLNDRAADNWFPLLAIAEVAGQLAPALDALLALNSDGDDDESIVTELLKRLRALFKEKLAAHHAQFLYTTDKDEDFSLTSKEIVAELNQDKEAPWADWREGIGLSEAKLAAFLRPFKIKSEQRQIKGLRGKRYFLGKLQRVFDSYLPTETPDPGAQPPF
jgi:hypothetical protein